YLGVDVFFVISGYLITSLIVMESEEGRYSLAGFWARRARRILPLLTLVILACLPAAWWLLAWRDITDFWQSLIAIGLFASNILFWTEGTYFGVQSELKPLLHTWSLSVEEQFYLIFPLFCAAMLRWAPHRLRLAFWLVCGLSFAAFLALQFLSATTAFYWLPARSWQLLTGSLCALALRRQSASQDTQERAERPNTREQSLALAGLILIGVAMALGAIAPFFRIVAPLPATLGAALVIRFAQADTHVAKGLSWRPLVAVGLVSYGAYLWHVPLLVFARHALAASADPELDRIIALPMALGVALCLLSLLLAAASWRWVEQPFRDRTRVSARTAIALGAVSWALILAFALTTARTDWQKQAYLTQTLGAEPQAAREFLHQMERGAVRPDVLARANPETGPCVMLLRRVDDAERQRIADCHAQYGQGVLLFGDSHAQGLHFALADELGDDAFFVTVAAPGCRLDFNWCVHSKLEETVFRPLPGVFASALYSEAGSARILTAQGRPDRQAAFADPSSAQIATASLD
ncbi:MAG: acyltransferase, partial [Pseudomonadota bacterium]